MEPQKNLNNIKFVSSRFSLPLFMVSRNRIKYTKSDELRKHIQKKSGIYKTCPDEEFEKTTIKHLKHLVGAAECFPSLTNKSSSKVSTRSDTKMREKPWILPPNLYDTIKIPYKSKKGLGGAHWPKIHTRQAKPLSNVRQQATSFYTEPKMTEKMFNPCNRTKGIFLTNARARRATTRCMVSHAGGCYKDPSYPGPTTYTPTYIKPSLPTNLEAPNSHLFHSQSIVPVKNNSIYDKHISFTGAPGRYDIRYPNICACSSKLIYQPQIDLLIDNEKRKKFRRLPFEVIKARYYTSPDWRHVQGRGYRHLFMGVKRSKQKSLTEQELKRQKNIKLYPDAKYISMINNPLRTPMSLRSVAIFNKLPQIKYNCIAKKISRKQLRSNKKIAFNSSQERFRDSYRLPILTQSQQEEIKQTLPLDRQFRDHPIMTKLITEIKSKLDQTPKHMLPNYVPKLRKKIFKFQPLPEAKILVTDDDTNVMDLDKEGFYLSVIDPKRFFKQSDTS